ncbi:MAG: hypothetical protein ABH867_02080 [Patescibacteria group bacterium]|nr:hypothetical protein [Patescibacteria group bacterium]
MDLKKYKPLFLPVGVIVFVVLFMIFFLPGQIGEVTKEIRAIKKNQKEVETIKTKYLLASSLNSKTLEYQASLASAALPETKNVPYILQGLRESVLKGQFAIKELSFSPGEIKKEDESGSLEDKKMEKLPLELRIVGPLNKITELFSSLEETAPLFQAESFDLSVPEKTGANASIQLRLSTFYSPPLSSYKPEAISLESLVLSDEEIAFLDRLDKLSFPQLGSRTKTVSEYGTRQNPFSF